MEIDVEKKGTRAGEGAGGEGEEEEAYQRRRGPSPLAMPSGRPEAPRPQRSRINHVLITEASLRYNTSYIKWSPKLYKALFNPYTRSKVTTQSYRK